MLNNKRVIYIVRSAILLWVFSSLAKKLMGGKYIIQKNRWYFFVRNSNILINF